MVEWIIGKEISAAIAISIPALAAAHAIATTGSAAAAAVAEKPEVSGKVLLFVALAEAIAIYGLVVALLILFQ
ncbi:MAG: ATP synthase subunit C [Candidatus Altiarchaeota archaeon]